MDMPTAPDSFKTKSFWEKKEGTTGMVVLAVLGIGGFFLLQAVLPAIISVLDLGITAVGKGITLGVLCAILAAFIYIVTNRKFLVLLSYMFKSIMRYMTGWWTTIDPIGIMKNYIDDLRERQRGMDDGIEKLRGQLTVCAQSVVRNESRYQNEMALAAAADKKGDTGQRTVHGREAERMKKLNNETYIPMQRTMEVTLRALKKYREVTDTVIQDMTNEVKAREDERTMILKAHSVMRAAQSILNGDPDKKELFDQAMEYVVADYGQKMGEIENFIETSESFVKGLDLQNDVYDQSALSKLQEWENKADSILLGDGKRQLLEDQTMGSPMTTKIGADPLPVVNTIEGQYKKFLN